MSSFGLKWASTDLLGSFVLVCSTPYLTNWIQSLISYVLSPFVISEFKFSKSESNNAISIVQVYKSEDFTIWIVVTLTKVIKKFGIDVESWWYNQHQIIDIGISPSSLWPNLLTSISMIKWLLSDLLAIVYVVIVDDDQNWL